MEIPEILDNLSENMTQKQYKTLLDNILDDSKELIPKRNKLIAKKLNNLSQLYNKV